MKTGPLGGFLFFTRKRASNMKNRCVLMCAIAVMLTIFSFGCFSSNKVRTANYSTFLTQDQITSFDVEARHGNGDAGYKLFEFYFFNDGDKSKALQWLSIAATNNNVSAQYDMAMYYNGEIYHDPVNINSAKYWFGRAFANGDTNALNKLNELGK